MYIFGVYEVHRYTKTFLAVFSSTLDYILFSPSLELMLEFEIYNVDLIHSSLAVRVINGLMEY